MKFKHNPQLTPFAKVLRKEMTKEERHLWYDFLHAYPVRFLRQKVIGNYNEVSNNFSGVCEYIDNAVKQSLSQLR